MTSVPSRRRFLQSAATAGTALGLGEWGGLLGFSFARDKDAMVTPDLIGYDREIAALARLIEETPREKCVELMMERFRKGMTYRQFLAALYQAGVTAKTYYGGHSAYAVCSAHQLSLELPAHESLMPVFWALDAYKVSLTRYPDKNHNPTLHALKGPLPSAEKAEDELRAGIERQDAERAERAIVALVRAEGKARVIDSLLHYAGRDFTFIGHKAIWVSGVCQLLQAIGWNHAEAQLRFVVRDLARHDEGMLEPYPANCERVEKSIGKLPTDWARNGGNRELTADLLVMLREGRGREACDLAVERLAKGSATAGAVWDAVFLDAGEQIMNGQQATGAPLHASTGANALRYAFELSSRPKDRLLLLLQALGWMVRYRGRAVKTPRVITELTPREIAKTDRAAADEILSTLSLGGNATPNANIDYRNQDWRHEAARKAFRFAEKFPDSNLLMHSALRVLSAKAGWDVHQIKFPVAMVQNYRWISPEWCRHYLAQSSYSFLGVDAPDSSMIVQLRAALKNG